MRNVCQKTAALLLCLTHVVFLSAQFVLPSMSPRAVAMGGTSTALSDATSSLYSVAPLATRQRHIIAIAYRHDYAISSTAHKSIAFALPVRPTTAVAASYHHYGNTTYNEQHLSLGIAQQIARLLSVAATIDYYLSTTSDGHYDPLHTLSFTASIYMQINKHWSGGLRIANASALLDNSILLPTVDLDLSYQPLPQWTTTVGIRYIEHRSPTVHGGIEYLYRDHIAARIGLMSNPIRYTFGLGYISQCYAIDIALQTHPILGLTPMIGGSLQL